jgi:hypothetical protein
VFVCTFYATSEALGRAYRNPSLESFCDAFIREKDNLMQLRVITTTDTSNKALVAQHKDKTKYTKKQHPHNNKQNKGPNPFPPCFTPNGNKEPNLKSKNIDNHCNFVGQDGHLESKCFKKMETLEATMKKHNNNLDYSSSHGHALSASSFSVSATYTSSYDE